MGRKAISGKPMETRIVVRLSNEEKDRIEKAASVSGKTVSTWARDLLLQHASTSKPASAKKTVKKAKKSD